MIQVVGPPGQRQVRTGAEYKFGATVWIERPEIFIQHEKDDIHIANLLFDYKDPFVARLIRMVNHIIFHKGKEARHLGALQWMTEQGLVVESELNPLWEPVLRKLSTGSDPEWTLQLARRVFAYCHQPTCKFVDASRGMVLFTGPMAFINHSCRPNCDAFWARDGGVRLIANRPIAVGEEITIAYLTNLAEVETDARIVDVRVCGMGRCRCCVCSSHSIVQDVLLQSTATQDWAALSCITQLVDAYVEEEEEQEKREEARSKEEETLSISLRVSDVRPEYRLPETLATSLASVFHNNPDVWMAAIHQQHSKLLSTYLDMLDLSQAVLGDSGRYAQLLEHSQLRSLIANTAKGVLATAAVEGVELLPRAATHLQILQSHMSGFAQGNSRSVAFDLLIHLAAVRATPAAKDLARGYIELAQATRILFMDVAVQPNLAPLFELEIN